MVELNDCLGQVREEVLEPELAICDAHHHLWDRPAGQYLIYDMALDVMEHNIVSTVFVECMAGYRAEGGGGVEACWGNGVC